jgi:hypothetical protein
MAYFFVFLSRDAEDKTLVRVAKIFRGNIVFLGTRCISMDHHMRAESMSVPKSWSAGLPGLISFVVELSTAIWLASESSYYGAWTFGKRCAPPKLNMAFEVELFTGDCDARIKPGVGTTHEKLLKEDKLYC